MVPPSGTTTSKQRRSFEQSGATTIPQITVEEERDVTSRQYLRSSPSDIREGFPSLRVRPDIPRSCPILVDPSSTGKRGLDSQTAQGARPKRQGIDQGCQQRYGISRIGRTWTRNLCRAIKDSLKSSSNLMFTSPHRGVGKSCHRETGVQVRMIILLRHCLRADYGQIFET